MEIESLSPLTPEAVRPVVDLVHKVFLDSREDQSDERLKHTFQFVLSANKVVEGAVDNFPDTSFILLAREGGLPIGFSIMAIAENSAVIDSFVGVDWQHLRQGIATQLMRASHDELKRRGIRQYHADIWEGSRKMLEKEQSAGRLKLEDDPEDKNTVLVTLLD